MVEKLKSFLKNDQIFYGVLLLLVGSTSFGLGRLSGPVIIEKRANFVTANSQEAMLQKVKLDPLTLSQESKATSETKVAGAQDAAGVVASKSGTKYHLPNCPGAKQIKPSNLISFATIAEAKAAGYSKASNCPGLE